MKEMKTIPIVKELSSFQIFLLEKYLCILGS